MFSTACEQLNDCRLEAGRLGLAAESRLKSVAVTHARDHRRYVGAVSRWEGLTAASTRVGPVEAKLNLLEAFRLKRRRA